VEALIASAVRHSVPGFWHMSPHQQTCQRLCLQYGVYPVEIAIPDTGWEHAVRRWLVTNGFEKELILLTQGPNKGHSGGTNRLELIHLDGSVHP